MYFAVIIAILRRIQFVRMAKQTNNHGWNEQNMYEERWCKKRKEMARNNSNWLGWYMMQVGVINTIYHKLLFAWATRSYNERWRMECKRKDVKKRGKWWKNATKTGNEMKTAPPMIYAFRFVRWLIFFFFHFRARRHAFPFLCCQNIIHNTDGIQFARTNLFSQLRIGFTRLA